MPTSTAPTFTEEQIVTKMDELYRYDRRRDAILELANERAVKLYATGAGIEVRHPDCSGECSELCKTHPCNGGHSELCNIHQEVCRVMKEYNQPYLQG
jgi:hypothetical protein